MNNMINIKVTDCTKTDITEYSEGELSLIVFNDETLYKLRHNLNKLSSVLDELYIYTQEQYNELIADLDDEDKISDLLQDENEEA